MNRIVVPSLSLRRRTNRRRIDTRQPVFSSALIGFSSRCYDAAPVGGKSMPNSVRIFGKDT